MLLWGRFFYHIATNYFKPSVPFGDEVVSKFRVRFIDCEDLNTLNSSRYFQFCEISEHATNVRVGFFKLAIRRKWWVVMRSQYIVVRPRTSTPI